MASVPAKKNMKEPKNIHKNTIKQQQKKIMQIIGPKIITAAEAAVSSEFKNSHIFNSSVD